MFLQHVLNPIGKLLILNRYKNKLNPFEEFRKLKEEGELPPITKGTVLLGPIRMSGMAHTFEGLIGYALRLQGYRVYALLCGQELQVCETKNLNTISNLKCGICYAEQKEFCKTYDIEPMYIGDNLTSKDRTDIEKSLSQLTIDEMLLNKTIDLKNPIETGLMRMLKTSSVNDVKYLPLLKQFGETSMKTYLATRNIIDKIKPDHVFMSHGVYSTWGAMIKACNDEGVHSVVWGRGYVGKGAIFATNDNSYLYENIIEPNSNYIDNELDDEKITKTLSYYSSKRNPKSNVDYISYYKGKEGVNDKLNLRERLNIDDKTKIFGMFPNIPWDGQAFSSSKAFPNIKEFTRSTVEWFKMNKDNHLVIRAHPAEVHTRSNNQLETFKDILFNLYPTLPENVTFLDADSDISSYQIEEHIEVALLYAGTLGLEFAINKTAVIQAGTNPSSGRGFIFEPNSESEFYDMLAGFESSELKMTDERFQFALKYAYYWIFERHVPEEVMKLEGELNFKGFNLKSSSDLANAKTINWFIDKMVKKEAFIYREANKTEKQSKG